MYSKKKSWGCIIEEEDQLWKCKQLGSETLTPIINTLFYYNGLHFLIWEEEVNIHTCTTLNTHQFHIEQEPRGLRKIVYQEAKTKTNAGGLKHRKVQPVIKCHYENIDQPEKCRQSFWQISENETLGFSWRFYLKPLSHDLAEGWSLQ